MPITVNSVSYTYMDGQPPALTDVTFTVQDGQLVGIMGRTGSGKTTLLNVLAGLAPPSRGEVLVDGESIYARGYPMRTLREKMGVVFQYPERQLFESTVEKDVAFGLRHSGMARAEIEARTQRALEAMGFAFSDIRGQSPLALSGGEKRRVAIAGVLAAQPRCLLLDEPIAGLDPMARELFLQLLTRLNRQGATILIISHNADAIAQCTQRLLVLENGRVALDDATRSAMCDARRMAALGMDGCEVTRLVRMLAARGVALPADTLRFSELLCALRAYENKTGE